jgi:transposase-like protein
MINDMSISRNDWIRNETVRFFLLGYSQERISKELQISIGSVNSILNEALSRDKTLELQRQIAYNEKKWVLTLSSIYILQNS